MSSFRKPTFYLFLLLLGGGLLSPLISYATLTLDTTSLTGDGALTIKSASSSATTIGDPAQSGVITIASTTQALTVDIGKSTAALTLSIAAGQGGHTVNIATGTSTAKTINIGTGASTTNTIVIGSSSSTVGVGTSNPHASAILHVSSTSKGFLPPILTTAQRDAISSPSAGLTVYNTSSSTPQFYDGSGWRTVATSTLISHTEVTGNTSVTATTEGTANTVVSAPAYTFDGNTTILIEFFAPNALKGTTWIRFVLYDGTSIGIATAQIITGSGSQGQPVYFGRQLVPSAASHTYSVRAFVDAGTGEVSAGGGGSGSYIPGYIRITRVY